MQTNDSLCVGVVINEFSFAQLRLLRSHIERLSRAANVILIKHQPSFPAVFYQSVLIRKLEVKANMRAKRDLYFATGIFDSATLCYRYIFNGPRVVQVLHKFPAIDCLVGHGLEKQDFLDCRLSSPFVGSLRAFIETYASVGKDDSIHTDNYLTYKSMDKLLFNFNEFLQEAKRTKTDEIKRLEFPWLKKG